MKINWRNFARQALKTPLSFLIFFKTEVCFLLLSDYLRIGIELG